ncbi:MAG: hypothetical protein V4628_13900 [Pseudomonadota bacterium]
MQNFTKKSSCAMLTLVITLGLVSCGDSAVSPSSTTAEALAPTAAVQETPRFEDGTIRFDRAPGELGYWANPSKHSLIENGVEVSMDDKGLLSTIDDAAKVAPFMDWSLALYKYRQQNGLQDDPANVCISPAGPRHLQDEGGFRIIQDRNYDRVYVMFGGGNRGWRLINMDGRTPPNPEEVTGSYYGYSTGHWEGDTLVVESSGFNDRFWFSNGGLPHTAALSLTERFSRPDHDTLLYQVTVTDPRTYTRPWTSEWTLEWVDGDIAENFCEQ